MAVAVALETDGDVRGMIAWGARLARCFDTPLLVIHATRNDGGSADEQVALDDPASPPSGLASTVLEAWTSVRQQQTRGVAAAGQQDDAENDDGDGDDTAPTPVELSFFRVRGPQVADAVLERLSKWGVELLLVPANASTDFADGIRSLFSRAACATLLLRPTGSMTSERPLVVPSAGHTHDHAALQLAARLGQCEARDIAALYVELDVGEVSAMVGRRVARRHISLAALGAGANVEPRVVVSDKLERGVREGAKPESCELLLLGVRGWGRNGAQSLGRLARGLIKWEEGPSVALYRPALPLHRRFLYRVETWLEDQLPQLTRDERVSLVDRIQSGSRWNIDFVALICLSTLIAALGLIRNSPAVVIGAMLVAPLMTPLMGAGLAVMQGNLVLAREAAAAVLGGFFLALLVSGTLGLVVIGLHPSPEMLARGSPGVLDLLVAFVSGMAAAYAVGRRNLSSALPGVAIAAALVPPIATSGMALAIGETRLAIGALLLFVTNIVAIVLGAAAGLWAVGVRARHQHGGYERWSTWTVTALVLATIALAVYESQPLPKLARSMEKDLQDIVFDHMADARLDFDASRVRRNGGKVEVDLLLQSAFTPPPRLAPDLRTRIAKEYEDPVTVRLRTELLGIATP